MTAATYVTIWCDGRTPDGADCGQYLEGDTAASVRRVARERGRGRWLTSLPGGRDLCPEHHDQVDHETRWGVP